MPRVVRRIFTIVYGLGIVAALSFGASQAFGRAVYLTCRYDPPTLLGACITGPDSARVCLNDCQLANPSDPEVQGRCLIGDCCVCFQ